MPARADIDRWPRGMVVATIASLDGKEITISRQAYERQTLELADDVVFCRFNPDGVTSTRMPDAQYLQKRIDRREPVTLKVIQEHKRGMVKMVWDGLPPKGTPFIDTQDYPNQRTTNYGGLEYSYPRKCK